MSVDTHQGLEAAVTERRVVEFARRVIGIPSPRFEEGPLADYLEGVMRGLGMETEFVPYIMEGKRSKNVIGRLRGTRPGSTVILNAHMDTGSGQYRGLVFQPERWTKDPFAGVVEDGWLYGLGTHNNKQGLTQCTMAVDALVRARVNFAGEIVLAFVIAETVSGVGTQGVLAHGLRGDMALVAEGTGLDIVTLSTGCIRGIITVSGDHQHHSQHVNAIEVAAKVVQAFGRSYRPLTPGEWMTFAPHPKLPTYPRVAIREIRSELEVVNLYVDVVAVPGQTAASVERDLRGFLARLEPQIEALRWTLELRGWEPPLSTNTHFGPDETPADHPLVRAVAAAHAEVRGEPPTIGTGRRLGGASDAQNFKNAGIPAIDYGAGSIREDCGTWPAVDERIRVRDLIDSVRITALAVANLCR